MNDARPGRRKPIEIHTLAHKDAKRRNIPTAEFESIMEEEDKSPIRLAYERRNRDLDPQLVWRGKDEQDWSDLVVAAPPLYIQEKVHPKVLIDDLVRRSRERKEQDPPEEPDLFADFNGLPDAEAKTEFYAHEQNWSNRMILGDSLQVMASLAEREGLRGKVQCIYIDPPYGIKFNSNFQWSTTSRDVKDGKADHITREPEQVKAFRDTWRDGIHSYLTYLRDRLTVARDLLAESGSIFVQIGDENVHRVRALIDEVFGADNFASSITIKKTTGAGSPAIGTKVLAATQDYVLWYVKRIESVKYRQSYRRKERETTGYDYTRDVAGLTFPAPTGQTGKVCSLDNLTSQTGAETTRVAVDFFGRRFAPTTGGWKTNQLGMSRLKNSYRLGIKGNTLRYVRELEDFPVRPINNLWDDISQGGFVSADKIYVVQTTAEIIQRCILMTTDPGDLVLDPTCGSGTTAYVAEQWGRRWITMDTSRVALALARARIMGARYPYYVLADSPEGLQKEAEITRTPPKERTTHGDIRQGFVYERVPHITLKSIANNTEIDVIWERFQEELEPLREELNSALGRSSPSLRLSEVSAAIQTGSPRRSAPRDDEEGGAPRDDGEGGARDDDSKAWEEWEIPREADATWPDNVKGIHAAWWEKRIARQKEIDASIAAKAEFEYLYDKPYVDNSRVRVAGPFTVESLSPHRVLAVDADDSLIDGMRETGPGYRCDGPVPDRDFSGLILENLKTSGVQQAHKEDRITFTSLTGWPGEYICAEGTFMEGEKKAGSGEAATGNAKERRAGVFIGPEFGTVSRPDLVAAAREAGDAGFDVLIACAFNYDAHSTEFEKLGRIPVLKARMNADLHMAGELKNTGKGNLFVIFGEPDIDIEDAGDGQVRVKINGVDVFHPQTGEITSSGPEGIACWFIDTDYNEESFFVRHAYFLGANDPYKALKTTLKAEIDEEAWSTLNSDISRSFDKPSTGRIAVKVINHLGDEVMKVFNVP